MGKPYGPFRAALATLVVLALLLPIALVVLNGIERLLITLGDAAGGQFLTRVWLGGAILWLLTLACLAILGGAVLLQEEESGE